MNRTVTLMSLFALATILSAESVQAAHPMEIDVMISCPPKERVARQEGRWHARGKTSGAREIFLEGGGDDFSQDPVAEVREEKRLFCRYDDGGSIGGDIPPDLQDCRPTAHNSPSITCEVR